jgi:hypothetical protein
MQVVPFPSRRARALYRHELRTLTYITLDAADTGVIRNLNSKGLRLQTVCALRERQHVRVQFNLRFPRLRVEADGEVAWIDSAGFCGIHFVDLPIRLSDKIDEWIFANLLETLKRHIDDPSWIFGNTGQADSAGGLNGFALSAAAQQPIQLDREILQDRMAGLSKDGSDQSDPESQLNWLSRPVSPATLAFAIDALLVLAALLMFVFIFISIAHELPSFWLTLGGIFGISILLVVAYWSLFAAFGVGTFGVRLMGIEADRVDDVSDVSRFR